jgi:Trypsin-like peptidase domain
LIDLKLIAWWTACFLGSLCSGTIQAQSWNDASVKVWNRTDSVTSAGSGTIIGSNGSVGLVLTVKHLFRSGVGEIVVLRRDRHGYRGTLLAIDECSDLAAVLIVDTDDLPQVPIARGQPMNAVLAGFGVGFHLELGEFTKALRCGDVSYSFHPKPGDSGGGLFAQDGSLAGVVWGRSSDGGVAVSASRIRRFLSWPACSRAINSPPVEYDEEVSPPPIALWHQEIQGGESCSVCLSCYR